MNTEEKKLEMRELQQTIKRNNPQEINKLLNEIKKTPLEVKFKSVFHLLMRLIAIYYQSLRKDY